MVRPIAITLTIVLVIASAPYTLSDSITLKSGEVIEGQIISETDTELRIEVTNQSRTITTMRDILKADVASVGRDSPEKKAEIGAYTALNAFKLNPDQELSASACARGIKAFEEFLSAYSRSDYAADVSQRLLAWQGEQEQVGKGLVKFGNVWMSPAEKKPKRETQAAQKRVAELTEKLARLQSERARTAGAIQWKRSRDVSTQGDEVKLGGLDSNIRQTQSDLETARTDYTALQNRYLHPTATAEQASNTGSSRNEPTAESGDLDSNGEIQSRLVSSQTQYLKELNGLAATYQAAGDLDSLLATKSEVERFGKQKEIQQSDLVQAPQKLRTLQEKYRGIFTEATRTYVKEQIKKLEEIQRKLTIDGKIDEAIAMRSRVRAIRKKYGIEESTPPSSGR